MVIYNSGLIESIKKRTPPSLYPRGTHFPLTPIPKGESLKSYSHEAEKK